MWHWSGRVILALACAVLLGAANAPAAAQIVPRDQAWVEMAPGGGSVVRLLTMAERCPLLRADGRARRMAERAAPATLAPRPNKAELTTGAAFDGRVCEARLARSTRRAVLDGKPLPLPPARITRIVLIGDTGCRLKDADKAWQGCNDPAQWPFAQIAARVAALHPDMVLHVGDYLYRENPCPQGQQNCAGAISGYGEASWRADFLDPAAPLLAAAPWAMVRGNHEECARAGQGWWRLLDPHALESGRDCLDAAADKAGNHTDPYAVDLGGSARLVVMDLIALANAKAKDPDLAPTVAADFARMRQLAKGAKDSFVTAHYPFNAVLWDKGGTDALSVGGKPVGAFAPLDLTGVRAMLAGHVHLFQYARFADRPLQVIAGFSGTMEDPALSPDSLAATKGKAGAEPLRALTTIAGRFGYALMERHGRRWQLTAYGLDGQVMGRFTL